MGVLLAWALTIVVLSMPRRRPAPGPAPAGRGWRRIRAEWWFAWERDRGAMAGLLVAGWYCGQLVLLLLRS